MTIKKIDRLSVLYRKEINWLQWYFLRDKKQRSKTVLEKKIDDAMLSGNHFLAKKYLAIKKVTEIMLGTSDNDMIETIKQVYVYKSINVIGACQKILYLSPTAAYNHIGQWFEDYSDMIFVLIPLK
ncbi:TPA: hypothetical protein TY768_000916 [Streptococcus suis]|nr:hypothetical protein [Streptococcus suis]